ncbi:M48 family metallopeptidase [Halohasta litorea]|uniref:M48 family metallopeptidase n=1 Tax=Halohasta litorea TaxID=869891 RepID=A0ABD6D5T1_9EURY|nr:M48 family metalloprotease [Halohasta litorea]
MTVGSRARLSLGVRMVAALGAVALVSASIVLVAAAVAGGLVVGGVILGGYFLSLSVLPASNTVVTDLVGQLSPATLAGGAVLVGLCLLPAGYLEPVRAEIREFKTELGTTGQLAVDRHPKIGAMAGRIAQQAGIPEPTVRIVTRMRPESYALGSRSDGTIVLTRGLVRALSDDEIEAVLAHEISHLANGDGRLMGHLLIPLLLAEHVGSDDRPTLQPIHAINGAIFVYVGRLLSWTVVTAVTTVQLWCCLGAIALFSRGRETAADRGAAELTGSPSSLASALETLDGNRGRPTEDLREFKRSAGALDILPPADVTDLPRPFRTHPPTERRVQRLEALVGKIET